MKTVDESRKMNLGSGYIEFKPFGGISIEDVLWRMFYIAKKTTATIRCDFNGHIIFITQDTTEAEINTISTRIRNE